MSDYILEMKDISKSFPGVKALDHVSLNVRPGTVHALMGENALVDEYRASYGKLCEIKAQIKKLSGDKESIARKRDILSYQIDEIEKARINYV